MKIACLGDTDTLFHCKIILLDGTEIFQDVKSDCIAQKLLDGVFQYLNMIETMYFGLRYLDSINQTHWLDTNKKLARQLKGSLSQTLYFGVKFYASDPCKLEEEITRYQFFLQIKQDILQGRLPVSFEVGAELSAYAVQSELGDFDPKRHSIGYVSELDLLPGQTDEIEKQICEYHKTLSGLVPSAAELSYLEKAKCLDMFGVDLHPVLGEDNIEYFLGLTPNGVIVLRNKTRVGNYFWPRITKVYFKGRFFMLRVKDKNNDESTYGFELPTKQACKHLWKCCVEHHCFFRDYRNTTSNRTSISRPPQPVQRVSSLRSIQRILPVDDTAKQTPLNSAISQPQESYNKCTTIVTESPQSTRSAPWGSVKQSKGLYSSSTNPSPRSLRSKHSLRTRSMHRSSSIDSESSCDGRSQRRRHTSGHVSDGSKASGRSHSKKARRKNRGSDSEFIVKHRRRRPLSAISNDSVNPQWCHVQQQHPQLQSAVIKNLTSRCSGYMNSGMESESEMSCHHRRKQKRHSRIQSRSPAGSHRRVPEELLEHFQYIDSNGMSEEQLKDIPYTKIETQQFSTKRSPVSVKSSKG